LAFIYDFKKARERIRMSIREFIRRHRVSSPLILNKNDSIEHLVNSLLNSEIDYALVSDDYGKIIGVVSLYDVLKLFINYPISGFFRRRSRSKQKNEKSPISTIIGPNAIKIEADWSLKQALELMVYYKLPYIIAMDKELNRPLAIITKREILSGALGIRFLIKPVPSTW